MQDCGGLIGANSNPQLVELTLNYSSDTVTATLYLRKSSWSASARQALMFLPVFA